MWQRLSFRFAYGVGLLIALSLARQVWSQGSVSELADPDLWIVCLAAATVLALLPLERLVAIAVAFVCATSLVLWWEGQLQPSLSSVLLAFCGANPWRCVDALTPLWPTIPVVPLLLTGPAFLKFRWLVFATGMALAAVLLTVAVDAPCWSYWIILPLLIATFSMGSSVPGYGAVIYDEALRERVEAQLDVVAGGGRDPEVQRAFLFADNARRRKTIEQWVRADGGKVIRKYQELGYLLVEMPADRLHKLGRGAVPRRFRTPRLYDPEAVLQATPRELLRRRPGKLQPWTLSDIMFSLLNTHPKRGWKPREDGGDLGFKLSGTGVKIALLDTGVATDHAAVACRREVAENYHGESDPDDGHGHGTHLAGILVSRDPVHTGLAADAELLVAKVLDDDGRGTVRHAVDGILWAVAKGANVILLGFSVAGGRKKCDGTCPLCAAVRWAAGRHVVVVTGVGVGGTSACPCQAEEVVVVGAIGRDRAVVDFRAEGAGRGRRCKPDLVAPGHHVQTVSRDGGAVPVSGPAVAAAHVAGVAALLWQLGRVVGRRSVRGSDIRSALRCAHRPAEVRKAGGRGIVNVWLAAEALGRRLGKHGHVVRLLRTGKTVSTGLRGLVEVWRSRLSLLSAATLAVAVFLVLGLGGVWFFSMDHAGQFAAQGWRYEAAKVTLLGRVRHVEPSVVGSDETGYVVEDPTGLVRVVTRAGAPRVGAFVFVSGSYCNDMPESPPPAEPGETTGGVVEGQRYGTP